MSWFKKSIPTPAASTPENKPEIIWGETCFAEYKSNRGYGQPWYVNKYDIEWQVSLDRREDVLELMRRLDARARSADVGALRAETAATEREIARGLAEALEPFAKNAQFVTGALDDYEVGDDIVVTSREIINAANVLAKARAAGLLDAQRPAEGSEAGGTA